MLKYFHFSLQENIKKKTDSKTQKNHTEMAFFFFRAFPVNSIILDVVSLPVGKSWSNYNFRSVGQNISCGKVG